MSYQVNELDRRLANLIRFGTIHAVDLDAKTVTVDIGDDDPTEPVPWLMLRAGSKRKTWYAPEVGEQVVLLSPGGDFTQGVAIAGIVQSDTAGFEAAGDEANVMRTALDAGDTFETKVGDMLLQLTNGAAKIGTNATQKASRADLVDDRFTKIMQYLTILHGVISNFASILEVGMGTPSVFATTLNAALAGQLPTILPTAADEVYIK